jgi:hypothetical protein
MLSCKQGVTNPKLAACPSGDADVAYQVFGEGPDLFLIRGLRSHVEYAWESPTDARF